MHIILRPFWAGAVALLIAPISATLRRCCILSSMSCLDFVGFGRVRTAASTVAVASREWWADSILSCWRLCTKLCYPSISFIWSLACAVIGVISDWHLATRLVIYKEPPNVLLEFLHKPLFPFNFDYMKTYMRNFKHDLRLAFGHLSY